VGVGEGASIAIRLGMAMAQEIAGLVILNGKVSAMERRSFFRRKAFQGLPVFIGHGTMNPVAPYTSARNAYPLLNSVGAEVRLESYATTHRIHPDMLRDVNRWIMGAVTTEPDSLPLSTQS
jgi:phospholipase/carboxylesterase